MKRKFTQPSSENHMRFLFMRESLINTMISAGPCPCIMWSRSCGCPDRVNSAYPRLTWRASRCLIGPENGNIQEDIQQTRKKSWWINPPASLPLRHTILSCLFWVCTEWSLIWATIHLFFCWPSSISCLDFLLPLSVFWNHILRKLQAFKSLSWGLLLGDPKSRECIWYIVSF